MKKFLLSAAALSLVALSYGCKDEGESCVDNIDCPGIQTCQAGVCKDPVGTDDCVFDADCAPFACGDSGACTSSCSSADDCAAGATCNAANQCVAGSGGNHVYTKVLLVSRTPDTGDDCREPNPGPDIDYVTVTDGGTAVLPTAAAGAHGDYCGSAPVTKWASPSVALSRTSFPETLPGECKIIGADTKYFFMGTGQAYEAGETLAMDTGYLVLDFDGGINDGAVISVWEVNGQDGSETVSCTNITSERPNDKYSVYLVSNQAPTVGIGTPLTSPNFVHLGEKVGIGAFTVVLD